MKKLFTRFLTLSALILLVSCAPKIENLKIGDSLYGFTLKEKQFVSSYNSMVYIFEHQKTGAKLVNMKNDDTNRVFAISFNTYPHDSTGKAHILEHSVLMGSKNYPSPNTFEELKKGSFSTYLNAFTSADMTTYPIATINSKEFKNMMSVYLDAVFYPNIYSNPNIMKQEGIRLDYNQKEKRLEYKGVVFNEMKGALGQAYSVISRNQKRFQFPNSTYTFESGGDPKEIPELTQESLTQFHTKFYHPSNSITFIYGDEELAPHLKFIDQKYFSQFDKKVIEKENLKTMPIDTPVEEKVTYGVGAGESLQGKYYYLKSYALAEQKDNEDNLGLSLLVRLLTKNQTSPLTKALTDAGLGTQIYSYVSTQYPWITFQIGAGQTDGGKLKTFNKTIDKVLNQLAEKGFDPKNVEGEIKTFEFFLREMDTGYSPMGIEILDDVKRAMAYDLNLFSLLDVFKRIDDLKIKVQDPNYLKGLIKKYLLKNSRIVTLEAIPTPGLTQKEEQEERNKLDKLQKEMTAEQLAEVQKQSEAFAQFQSAPDKEEDLQKIPRLTLKDIDEKIESIPEEVITLDKTTVLYHPLFTKGITYLDLSFDMSVLSEEQIPYANLLKAMLENLPTTDKSLEELQTEKALHTGYAYNSIFTSMLYQGEGFAARFKYIAGTLDQNLPKTLDFLKDIILNTNYHDYTELEKYMQNTQADEEGAILNRPSALAANTSASMLNQAGAFNFRLSGYPYYWMIRRLNKDFAKNKEEIAANLSQVAKVLFNRNNLLIGVTADAANKEKILESLKDFVAALPNKEQEKAAPIKVDPIQRIGLIIPGKVQYASMNEYLSNKEAGLSGQEEVLSAILENEYLHPEIRQKGGAYGAYAMFGMTGELFLSSYRDPNLGKTLETFKKVPDYLAQMTLSPDALEKYIIGSVKIFDAPKTNKQKGAAMINRYLMNYTLKDREKIRADIIHTTLDQLKKFNQPSLVFKDSKRYVVAGSEEAISKEKNLFDRIIQIFE